MTRSTLRIIFIAMLLLLALLATAFALQFSNIEVKVEEKALLPAENGIVTNIWIDQISRLDALRIHRIKYLFVDVGGTDVNGTLLTPEEEITSFLAYIKEYENATGYHFILLPYSEIIIGDYSFHTRDFEKNILADYLHLSQLGFDGVFLDIEKIPPDQQAEYLALIEEFRAQLPPQALLVVYAGHLSNQPNEWEWDEALYRDVIERVDFVTVPGYDIGIRDKRGYQSYITAQLNAINGLGGETRFFLGVPTHKKAPETLGNALEVYAKFNNRNDSNFVGVSIFSEWTIDSREWKIYETYF